MHNLLTLYSGLPPPFNVLQCIDDSRRKGRRVLAILNDNFGLSAYMAPPGIAITPADSYKSFNGIGWMQCTNVERHSSGYICIGRHNVSPKNQRISKEFCKH